MGARILSTGDMFRFPLDTGQGALLIYSCKRYNEYVFYRLDSALSSAAQKMHCFDEDDVHFILNFQVSTRQFWQTKELRNSARTRGSELLEQYTDHLLGEHVEKLGVPRDIDQISIHSAAVSLIAHEQKDGTCYAHAAATAIRAVEERIVGRMPQSFEAVKKRIVKKHGTDGGNTFEVLQEQCKARNLRCEKVEEVEVLASLENNRVVVALFELAEYQYKLFSKLVDEKPSRVLIASDMLFGQKNQFPPRMRDNGRHSIVICGVDASDEEKEPVYKIKNSWGGDWGHDGYFYVEAGCLHVSV